MIDSNICSMDDTTRKDPIVFFQEFVLFTKKSVQKLRCYRRRDVEVVGKRNEVRYRDMTDVTRTGSGTSSDCLVFKW